MKHWRSILLWGGLLLALVVANHGIVQRERILSDGRVLLLELAPVDPRSLMQGDYMALRFAFTESMAPLNTELAAGQRPHVVALRDGRGIATQVRPDLGAPLATNELRIELTPKNGDWVLVTDAWFFKEGEADRWALAKFGEFRVAPNGRALLVGLRGADLKQL